MPKLSMKSRHCLFLPFPLWCQKIKIAFSRFHQRQQLVYFLIYKKLIYFVYVKIKVLCFVYDKTASQCLVRISKKFQNTSGKQNQVLKKFLCIDFHFKINIPVLDRYLNLMAIVIVIKSVLCTYAEMAQLIAIH